MWHPHTSQIFKESSHKLKAWKTSRAGLTHDLHSQALVPWHVTGTGSNCGAPSASTWGPGALQGPEEPRRDLIWSLVISGEQCSSVARSRKLPTLEQNQALSAFEFPMCSRSVSCPDPWPTVKGRQGLLRSKHSRKPPSSFRLSLLLRMSRKCPCRGDGCLSHNSSRYSPMAPFSFTVQNVLLTLDLLSFFSC